MTTPKVFVTYSHDDIEHKQWVRELATRLRRSGVDVILDQWDLDAGQDLGSFMTNSLREAERVIMVCTPNYVSKANEGLGGVGVERMILTAEYLRDIDSKKVIPIIKKHSPEKSVPDFFETKVYIDFSRKENYEASLDELLRSVLNKPLFEKPELGASPFDGETTVFAKKTHDPVKDLMKVFIRYYEETGRNALSVNDIHRFKVASSRTMSDFIISQALSEGLIFHNKRNGYLELQDRGKAYAIENGLI